MHGWRVRADTRGGASTVCDVFRVCVVSRYIDLVIPRGGNALVKFIKDNTTIPVMGACVSE